MTDKTFAKWPTILLDRQNLDLLAAYHAKIGLVVGTETEAIVLAFRFQRGSGRRLWEQLQQKK